jgi:hypothetical protein
MTTITGVFTSRLGDAEYRFKDSSNDEVYRLSCGFEPVLDVIEYRLACVLPTNPTYSATIKTIFETRKLPWSEEIADILKLGDYVHGETFAWYCARMGARKQQQQLSTMQCKLWMYWPLIECVRLTRDVSPFDSRAIEDICDHVHKVMTDETLIKEGSNGLGEMTRRLVCNPYVYVYSDALQFVMDEDLRVFTLIQEMKDVMKREQVWDVKLVNLTRWKERFNPELIAKIDKTRYPVRWNSETKSVSFVPQNETPVILREDEPVDYYANRMIKWTLPETTKKSGIERCPVYHPISATTKEMRRIPSVRIKIPGGIGTYQVIKTYIEEMELKRVMFVFGDGMFGQRSWYDSMNLPKSRRAVLPRVELENSSSSSSSKKKRAKLVSNPRKLRWAKKTPTCYYEVDEVEYTRDTFWKAFRSLQTCGHADIGLIAGSKCEAVFFFGNLGIHKRWLQWCHRVCGENIRLCLVDNVSDTL